MVHELLVGQRKHQASGSFPLEARKKNLKCKHGFNQLIDHANMEKYGANRLWEI